MGIGLPSGQLQFSTMVALLDISPSFVQFPPLTQAHTSTTGVNVDEAPLESLARKVRGAVVTFSNLQWKLYSPFLISFKAEFGGSPPIMSNVKSSPGSSTSMVKTDSCPKVMLKTASAEILGGKFSVK